MSGEKLAGVIAVAIVVYLVLLTVHPVHRCPGCHGRKVVKVGKTSFRPCRRCKGQGKAYRRGAVLAHRLLREHVWPWVHDRIIDRVAERIEGGDS
jgi:hypothetical protein